MKEGNVTDIFVMGGSVGGFSVNASGFFVRTLYRPVADIGFKRPSHTIRGRESRISQRAGGANLNGQLIPWSLRERPKKRRLGGHQMKLPRIAMGFKYFLINQTAGGCQL